MKKATRFIVKGTVQGVFFRRFIKESADNLKLRGFVRNLSDGNVEIVAEGEQETLDRLLGLVKEGHDHAQIRNIEVEERKWSGDFADFRVLKF
jgi:acylphosphatase